MSIKVLKAGMLTSIQDKGRQGLMHLGVANGGAMDKLSMSVANWLVGNPLHQPVLEICLTGPTLYFEKSLSIAISGAMFELSISNGQSIRTVNNNQTVQVNAGETLQFGRRQQGARAYLAIAGELSLSQVLGSYATHFLAQFGGFHGRALSAGDVLPLKHCEQRPMRALPSALVQHYSGSYQLRCTDSVETTLFNNSQQHNFYHNTYTISSQSNRMGLRLTGHAINEQSLADITSSGLITGSIQIPPNGQPIITSVDGQTIGGYPRIANVISADIFALGQLVAGNHIQFVQIDIKQAQQILIEQQSWLKKLLNS